MGTRIIEMKRKQQGAALVIGLLLLAVATIIGVAGLSGSNMQERIASNQRLQTEAFMAAESGAASAVEFANTDDNWPFRTLVPTPIRENECSATSGAWTGPWSAYDPVVVAGSDAEYKRRLLCEEDDGGTYALLLESEGIVGGQANPLSERTVYVEIEGGPAGTGPTGLSPLNFVGPISTFDSPNSNALQVDGQGGPAIATSSEANYNLIHGDIAGKGRLDNYDGGIAHGSFGSPFNSADQLMSFVTAAGASTGAQTNPRVNQIGSVAAPKISIFNGDLSLGGNDSGAGILIVKGNLSFNGTPAFHGLVIVLGGSFEVSGGGRGGNFYGSVVVAKPVPNHHGGYSFAGVEGAISDDDDDTGLVFDVSGGGTADYIISQDYLANEVYNLLSPQAKTMWDPAGSFSSGPTTFLASKISGWRGEKM